MGDNSIIVLDRAEVEEIMASVYDDHQIIPKDVEISLGAEKGDGYLSFLTRVDVVAEEGKSFHVVIKCAPRLEMIRKYVPIHDAYLREIHIYDVIMPAFEKFQKDHGVPRPFNNIPKCYKTQSGDYKELLVLENIRADGFQLWDRMKFMNFDHIQFVFKTYGKLHAISYAMQQREPEAYAQMTCDLFEIFSPDRIDQSMSTMIEQGAAKVQELFANEPEHAELYDVLTKFKDGELRKFWSGMSSNRGKHPVLRHGDCWVNNMMFKYAHPEDTSKPSDIRLLDFQLAATGSPATDLSYFLYVSAPKDLLDQLDALLAIYHHSLTDALKAMHCDPNRAMSFDELKREWKEFARFGFIMSIMVSRPMMMEKDEIIDFTDVTDDNMEELMARQGKNDVLVAQKLKQLAIHMFENGFLPAAK